MNLLAIIIVLLAIVTAGAIAYVAWELSSGNPVFRKSAPSDDSASKDSTDG